MKSRPNQYQLERLRWAVRNIDPEFMKQYRRLKDLRGLPDVNSRSRLRDLFITFYGLNAARLADPFKDRFFELLFKMTGTEDDPYTAPLLELYDIPRSNGKKQLQFSFVSKMVALHDERRPVFDGNVCEFFGIGYPSSGSPEFRIAGFLENLDYLCTMYSAWGKNPAMAKIVNQFRKEHPSIKACHPTRLIDFLIWTLVDHDRRERKAAALLRAQG